MPSNVTAAVAPPSLKHTADSSSSASAMQARPGSFTHCTCATSPGSSATAAAKVFHWSPPRPPPTRTLQLEVYY